MCMPLTMKLPRKHLEDGSRDSTTEFACEYPACQVHCRRYLLISVIPANVPRPEEELDDPRMRTRRGRREDKRIT